MSRTKSRGHVPVFFWIILALLALALVYRLVRPGTAHAQHPWPRPGITAAHVESPGQWSDQPDVSDVYGKGG